MQTQGRSASGRIALGCVACIPALAASACGPEETLTVSVTADGAPGSLREAVARANASPRTPFRIELPSGTYQLTACGADDTNAAGDLDLTMDAGVTFVATGPGVVIQQTCPGERVLDAHGFGRLTLNGITITGGSVTSADPGLPADGAGVRARGNVWLVDATITNNKATGARARGAVFGGTPTAGGAARGAGLYVGGSLTATRSTLSLNIATGGPGADAPTLDGVAAAGGSAQGGGAFVLGGVRLNGGSVAQNRAVGGNGGYSPALAAGGGFARGGGIAQHGSAEDLLTLSQVTLLGNTAQGGGANGGNEDTSAPAGDATGGAIFTFGSLTGTHVTASQNAATGGSTRTDCPTDVICNSFASGGSGRGGALAIRGLVTLESSSLSSNRAASGDGFFQCFGWACSWQGVPSSPGVGGAIWAGASLSLSDVDFATNAAETGLGLPSSEGLALGGAAASDADVTIERGNFTGNESEGPGGAISGLNVTVTGADFTGNIAYGRGGAISAAGLVATRTTASQNKAGGQGGGAFAVDFNASITGCDIVENTVSAARNASSDGGGILTKGDLRIENSNVLGNRGRAYLVEMFGGDQIMLEGGFTGGGIKARTIEGWNVTIARNQVTGVSRSSGGLTGGAGIAAVQRAYLTNATLSENVVVTPNHGYPPDQIPNQGAAVLGRRLELVTSTIADNTGSPTLQVLELYTIGSAVIAADGQAVCASRPTVERAEYNHFSDDTCALPAATNQQTRAPFLLASLADNGGPVLTRKPAFASVLIDQIPAEACDYADARGVRRPQGAACDIGAVEVEGRPAAAGADLSVAFVNPPATVGPDSDVAWQLTVVNNGPNPSSPALSVDIPAGVRLTAASATGGSCSTTDPAVCVWSAPLAAGEAATVTLTSHVELDAVGPLAWSAEVYAVGLQAPFTDDRATLSVPISRPTGLTLHTVWQRAFMRDNIGRYFEVPQLYHGIVNAGPATAVGTNEQPIEVVFRPAPGVQATPLSARYVGTFAPGAQFGFSEATLLQVPGAVPAELGILELLPGLNQQAGVSIPIIAADVGIRAYRSNAAQAPGTATSFRFEVTNYGPGLATNLNLGMATLIPSLSLSADRGTIENQSWQMASLAPGETGTLTGAATNLSPEYPFASLQLFVDSVDFNSENESVEVDLRQAPSGTSDLQVTGLESLPGSEPYLHVLRATVVNAGPATLVPSSEQPIRISLLSHPNLNPVSARAITAGWTCSAQAAPEFCSSARTLAVGESATVEFTIGDNVPNRPPRLGVQVHSDAMPDADPNNNIRRIIVTDAG